MKDTRAERITDTLVFQHRRITNPTVSVADAVTNAANDLTEAIKGNMGKQLKNVDLIELERLATMPTTFGIEKVLESSTVGNDECSHGSRNRRHDGIQTSTKKSKVQRSVVKGFWERNREIGTRARRRCRRN
jgi:hypothetical protein